MYCVEYYELANAFYLYIYIICIERERGTKALIFLELLTVLETVDYTMTVLETVGD